MITNDMIIQIILALIWAPFIGWFMFLKKKDKDTLDNLHQRVTKIEAEYMTEESTKRIIREIIQPLKEDYKEIKDGIQSISESVTQLRIDVAVTNARRANHEQKSP